MGNEIELGGAGRQYAAAHAAHYVARDLPLALQLYKAVLEHAGSGLLPYTGAEPRQRRHSKTETVGGPNGTRRCPL
jgi:hypothetical protein